MSTYQKIQHSNTERFNQLTKEEQQELKAKGYRNVSYEGVTTSTRLLDELEATKAIEDPLQYELDHAAIAPFTRPEPPKKSKGRLLDLIDLMNGDISTEDYDEMNTPLPPAEAPKDSPRTVFGDLADMLDGEISIEEFDNTWQKRNGIKKFRRAA